MKDETDTRGPSRRGLAGRKQTRGTCPRRVRGRVQPSVGKHATIRQATSKAARRGAKWGPGGAPGEPGGPGRGGSPPCLSVRRLRGCPGWVVLGAVTRGSHLGGDGVAAAQRFLPSTSSWGWAGASASSWS